MKHLLKSLVRRLGYQVSKLPPPPSPALRKFLEGQETGFEPGVIDDAGSLAEGVFHPLTGPPRRLTVEGWRFLPHSYAMVNQWQLLALARRPDISLKLLDAPLYERTWPREEGSFDPQTEQALKSLAMAEPEESGDVMLRLFFPYDFSPSRARRTAVFGTSENQALQRNQCCDFRMYERFRRGVPPPEDVIAITPSRWSAEGFYKAGFKPEQVLVIPHGVDTGIFHPMPGLRDAVRDAIGIARDDFVFLSVGAMTGSKGIDLLLQAFAQVSRRFPYARLVLKGMNPLYNSRDLLLKAMQKIPAADQERVIRRVHYFGNSFSNRKMALLYQAAEVYVSPYRAEGFNIPVLEAAASGIAVICTDGGSTDDFVTDAFARKISAGTSVEDVDGQELIRLRPDLEHLTALMMAAVEDSSWRKAAAAAGPQHVRTGYTWDHVVDRLVHGL